jgi:hypothetical protein
MKLIIWILIILSWITILKYRYQIYEFTGDWDWAVKYLGGNGTIVAIALIGSVLIALGTAYPFGVVDMGPGSQGIDEFPIQWTNEDR